MCEKIAYKNNIHGFRRHKYSTNQNFIKHSRDDFSMFPLARVSRIFAEDGAENRGSCGKNKFTRQNRDTGFAKNSDDMSLWVKDVFESYLSIWAFPWENFKPEINSEVSAELWISVDPDWALKSITAGYRDGFVQ